MLAENDALTDGEETVEGDEDVVFVLGVSAVHVELPDVVDCHIFLLELDLVRVGSEFGCEDADVVGESGGEEDDLGRGGFREQAVEKNMSVKARDDDPPDTHFFTRNVWSPRPSWSSMLSASSRTKTLTPAGSMTFRRSRSVMVPGVPTTICAVMRVVPLGRASLIAYSVCTSVNFPMAMTTDIICRANSRDGAKHKACGNLSQWVLRRGRKAGAAHRPEFVVW